MARRAAYPFLTLHGQAVCPGPWEVSVDGGSFADLGEWIPGWDYQSSIRLEREIRYDWAAASTQLGIDESEMALQAVVSAGTGAGTLPQDILQILTYPLSPGATSVRVEITLGGAQLSHSIHLATCVVLAAVPASRKRLAPCVVGARLWSDTAVARLEGEEPRFPIHIVPFSTLFGPQSITASAPWFLQWSAGDPNRDFHGAVRLYINEDLPGVVERILQGDTPLIQAMLGDVLSQLVEGMVGDSETCSNLAHCDPGSIGATVQRWLESVWPGQPVEAVAAQLHDHPGRFRAALLGFADLGVMGKS